MNRDLSVYECTFQAYVEKASVHIKFPCTYFLEWKTSNNKKVSEGKHRPSAVNNQVNFQQTLQLTTELLFDNSSKVFVSKESLLNLNLISKSRKEMVKLVGRVALDLAQIINQNSFSEIKSHKLAYCSVDGEILFSVKMSSSKLTMLNPQDIDKTSYNHYLSFYSHQNLEGRGDQNEPQMSIEFPPKKKFEKTANYPHKTQGKDFHQTVFVMPLSPRQHTDYARNGQRNMKERQGLAQTDTITTLPKNDRNAKSSKDLFKRTMGWRENTSWQEDKDKFRDEIDCNRVKISELEKKIIELCSNLEDSRKLVEMAQKQNKYKERVIRELKCSPDKQKEEQFRQIQEKYGQTLRQKDIELRKVKISEQGLKKELCLINASNENLRRQTDELRMIWREKKQHYDQKINHLELTSKEKDQKVTEVMSKIQDLSKYKYQYQLLKQLNQEKDSKIKMLERDMNKLSLQLTALTEKDFSQQHYKLKLNYDQLMKNYEENQIKLTRTEEQVTKYKQDLIKISTAYEIQGKNFENQKEKYEQLEAQLFQAQKQSIEHKNTINNLKRQLDEVENSHKNELSSLKALSEQKDKDEDASDKKSLRKTIEQQENIISEKEIQYNNMVGYLQSEIGTLKEQIQVLEEQSITKDTKLNNLSNVVSEKEQKITTLTKQIEQLKGKNQELSDSVFNLNLKEKELTQTIAVLEQESQKIISILQQKQQAEKQVLALKQNFQLKITETQMMKQASDEAKRQVQQFSTLLQQKTNQLAMKQQQIEQLKEETGDSIEEISGLKEVLRELNEKYQEQIKLEEKHLEELNSLKQEKEEIEVAMSSNLQDLKIQNEQLQNKISLVEEELLNLQKNIVPLEDQKKQLQSAFHEKTKSIIYVEQKYQQTQQEYEQTQKELEAVKINLFQQDQRNHQLLNALQIFKDKLLKKEEKSQQLNNLLKNKDHQLKAARQEMTKSQKEIKYKEEKQNCLEQHIISLEMEILAIKQQFALKNEGKQKGSGLFDETSPIKNNFQQEHQLSKREEELHQMLLESDRKNENLQERIEELEKQIQLCKKIEKEPTETLYQTFSQFQQQEMNKIIDQQKLQIQNLENELKKHKDSGSPFLEKRISQLQNHIIQLEQSFKLELQRLLAEQNHNGSPQNVRVGSLDTIKEQGSEQDCNRSFINSLSRVKYSMEGTELLQLREKCNVLQEDKARLEQECRTLEEAKFNMMSTLQEKQITIEQLLLQEKQLKIQLQRLAQINAEQQQKILSLEKEMEGLRSQIAFGSNMAMNENVRTRSEPVLSEEMKSINKQIEIQNLKAEIESQKNREEELLWNIKNLQMQLQTVTQNLNALNTKTMKY